MVLLPLFLAAQAALAPHVEARRTLAAPRLDGQLDDAAWRGAPASEAFTQKRPAPGTAPVERTRFRVLYDDDAIYVGVECDQARAPVVARLTRRDREIESDSVTVSLDTRGDGRTAFEFSVNAAGVLSDGARFNDTAFNRNWDEVWEARTSVTERGWSVEIRIPLHALRFQPQPVQSWGLQVRRYVSARQELDEWAFTPPGTAAEVSRYGRLDALVGLRSTRALEFLPFVTARVYRRDVPPEAEEPGFLPAASAGLDLRWHVTPRLTLNATFNPDFGQVEADPAVLNLGTFEIFFPERRPFFLDGADTFTTPLELVYTRRIGRAPPSPATPDGEELVEDPQFGTIYGASRLVGEVASGVAVGALTAVTGPQRLLSRGPDGEETPRLADPLTTFKVLRLRADVGAGLQVGGLVTAVNRLEPAGAYPIVPGPDGAPRQLCPGGQDLPIGRRCFRDAYVGGLDALWRSPSGDYTASGQAAASLIHEGTPRVQRDGTEIASGDISPGGTVRVAKEGGSWLWELNYRGMGRRLDYNDLGFMRRQNEHAALGAVGFKTLEPWWATLQTSTKLTVSDRESLDLLNLERRAGLESEWQLRNFWWLWARVGYSAARFDDREVGDGAALERAGSVELAGYVGTDPRARVRAEGWAWVDLLARATRAGGGATLAVNALPQLDLSLSPEVVHASGEPRYFGDGAGEYLFGRQLAQSVSLTLRSTYTFTPRLTLELYAQAFLAAEAYSEVSAFPAPASGSRPRIGLDDLRPPLTADIPSPDYELATLNANVVLRWEYLLGSTLFIVYTHGQSDDAPPSVPGDPARLNLRLLRPRLASDVFLMKLTYWWS